MILADISDDDTEKNTKMLYDHFCEVVQKDLLSLISDLEEKEISASPNISILKRFP